MCQCLTSRAWRSVFAVLLLLSAYTALVYANTVGAQGFIVEPSVPKAMPMIIITPPPRPIPPVTRETSNYSISEETIQATLNDSVAQVNVSQTFKNEGSTTIEASFIFPLPYDGAIDSMTLMVDGKEYAAKLLDKEQARKQYEDIVRKNRDPALLEWIGTGMFQSSVFPIPAGESRTVTISYTQLLRHNNGLTEFIFPLSCARYTSKPIAKLKIEAIIKSDVAIKNVYSPTYNLKVERNGANNVVASVDLQNQVPTNDFKLFFDQNPDDLSAKIQSYRPDEKEDGYFLLLATPKIIEDEHASIPKTVVFALDVSGSMSGQKIAQARDSLAFVLERLHDNDKFNIVLFDSDIVSYKDELQVSTPETRADAINYVKSVRSGGMTNIEGALKTSFAHIDKDESTGPKYLIFLSDGDATTGVTDEMQLAKIARNFNKKNTRVFTFGVGYDVNSRLLDRFVRDGRGQGEYVEPNENIEERVAALYNHIESPIFTEVQFDFIQPENSDAKYFVNQVYPSERIDLYSGEQLVVVGRYSTPGKVQIKARGKVGEKDCEYLFEGDFTNASIDSSYAFIERLWAGRRVGEIIDLLDLNGMNKELLDELLELAKKHGILTPYTSFLADDSVALNDSANASRLHANFDDMAVNNYANASGVAQRRLKQNYRRQNSLADSSAESVAGSMDLARSASRAMGGSMSAPMAAPRRSSLSRAAAPALRNAQEPLELSASLDDLADNNAPQQKMRNIAGKTFYFKNNRWIDASITEELEKALKPIDVEQFSDDYFELIAKLGSDFAQYLTFDEPVDINYRGQIYHVNNAQ
ncbi:MAG: VIT domain-containing protein [Planctomycetia bacterium]|nr:VIT domain-containing protein [Planctomycetia bacterium]